MQIGRYEVLEELGRGGMGAVYRGRDPASGREVAIKVLLEGRHATPRQRTRFDREARALAKVDHPSVVRLLEVGEEEGAPFLATAYHPEGSLADALKTALLSPLEAIRHGALLASALEAAHAQGVLHRDLKPENVLLGPNGFPVLTDFGLAKDLSREGQTQALTQSGTLQGTPGFWSPEQAAGRPDAIGPATDVYGLGAILYAALSGRAPIVGEGLLAILTATAEERPPPLRSLRPEVPRALEAVVMRCLEKDPAARWVSPTELGQALEGPRKAGEAPSRSFHLRRLAGAGVVVALGGALVVGSSRSTRPEATPSRLESPSVAMSTSPEPTTEVSAEALLARGAVEQQAGRSREAAALFRQAAERGNPSAMVNLGVMLADGQGVIKDEAQAVEWYRRSSERGSPDAMYKLGVMLMSGRGVPKKDRARAIEWYRRSAEEGHSDAMYTLGVILGTSRIGTEDRRQSVRWMRRAAEQGHAEAMYSLGGALVRGWGATKDQAEAARWYRRAADKGHTGSMFKLGVMLGTGQGLIKDRARSVDLVRRAAERGHVEAMYSLGGMLSEGWGGTKDEAQAAEWFRRAAEQGNMNAMFNLGRRLTKGQGVPKDNAEAAKWFRHAADKGHSRAMFTLGGMLAIGQGVIRDEAEANEWFRRSADQGHAPAMVMLGRIYAEGWGVSKDEAEAVEWYRRAALGEDPSARQQARAALDKLRQKSE